MDDHVTDPDTLYHVTTTGGWTGWAADRVPACGDARHIQARAERIADELVFDHDERWAQVRHRGEVVAEAGTLPKRARQGGRR